MPPKPSKRGAGGNKSGTGSGIKPVRVAESCPVYFIAECSGLHRPMYSLCASAIVVIQKTSGTEKGMGVLVLSCLCI